VIVADETAPPIEPDQPEDADETPTPEPPAAVTYVLEPETTYATRHPDENREIEIVTDEDGRYTTSDAGEQKVLDAGFFGARREDT
jgi:hypothetical protein